MYFKPAPGSPIAIQSPIVLGPVYKYSQRKLLSWEFLTVTVYNLHSIVPVLQIKIWGREKTKPQRFMSVLNVK